MGCSRFLRSTSSLVNLAWAADRCAAICTALSARRAAEAALSGGLGLGPARARQARTHSITPRWSAFLSFAAGCSFAAGLLSFLCPLLADSTAVPPWPAACHGLPGARVLDLALPLRFTAKRKHQKTKRHCHGCA